jgi:peptidoglycan DL-endopeptidase CwlO
MRKLIVLASLLAALTGAGLSTAPAAHAAPLSAAAEHAPAGYIGDRLLNLAETRTGDWYVYDTDGPSTFDCSGLVWWAATAAGEQDWPRDTYEIAAEIGTRFTITSHPERGDLALWGPVDAPYHVEFVTVWNQTTFGAQQTGTQVSWHYQYPGWGPSFYLHINY